MAPAVLKSVAALRETVAAWRSAGGDIALVPTMGALHAGHMALVSAARADAARTIATIFVNPTQFAPTEDFAAYPRGHAEDLAKLEAAGVDAVFMPAADAMYPPGFATTVSVAGVTDGLEGASRPHFFNGVATVVAKLLLQCLPDSAFFGEKDYQQLITVRRMARDLDIPCRIEAVPTVRDHDGVALSSRNAYLSGDERTTAAALFRVLSEMADALAVGANVIDEVNRGIAALRAAGFAQVDYVAVCDAETLVAVDRVKAPARVLAAAHLGATRLIDNVPVRPA
jgi:pantoate--beta-alanine ligase